jgi:uncharacterized RDD family membrane protein YckC
VTTRDPADQTPEPDAETARVPLEPQPPTEPAQPHEPAPPTEPEPPPTEPDPPPASGIISAQPVGWIGPGGGAAGGGSAGEPVVAWATPAAKIPATVSEGVVIAGVFSRLVAYSVDLLLLGSLNLIVSSVLGLDRTGNENVLALVVTAGFVGVDILYFVGFWSSPWQATLGMRLLKLRVLGATTAGTLSVNDAVLRWLALTGAISIIAVVPGLIQSIGWITLVWGVVLLITTASHPLHQGLHDRWARSVVAQPAPGGSGLAFATCLFLVVLFFLILPAAFFFFFNAQLQDLLTQYGQSI